EDFLQAVKVYQEVITKTPELAIGYYYLGRTCTVLDLYYTAVKDETQAAKYKKSAQEAFKSFVGLRKVIN
ncbi:MAG: hypothetical protein V1843_03685, partial [bacterium]